MIPMHVKTMAIALCAVALSASGQLFMKLGAQRKAGLGDLEFLFAAARDMHVLSGLLAWTASTLCWLYVLRVIPLSRAYGLTSLTYVLVFLASIYIVGEQVRRVQVMGMVLIIVGIACLLSGD